jgi:hypothetical protein
MNYQTTTFQHIGAARLFAGSIRIDIKTMQAVISRSDIPRLVQRWPVNVYDISDVMKTAGQPEAVGRAWITRSGRAVMYLINGTRYFSPLSQIQGVLQGTRKYANVSVMGEISGDNHSLSSPAGGEVPA